MVAARASRWPAGTIPEMNTRLKSMTGFGRSSVDEEEFRFDVEVKGVNHRFLDVKLRLPAELVHFEPDLRSRVKQHVARGRVDVSVSLKTTRRPAQRVEIRRQLVGEYLTAVAALKKEFRLTGSIGLDRIVALPGVMQITTDADAVDGRCSELLVRAFAEALRAYDLMRSEEGARLEADLRARLKEIAAETSRIEAEGKVLPAQYASRLQERIAALTAGRGLDQVRLAQEVALLADHVDTTEEIVRLKGYLEQVETMLAAPAEAAGKTLDFIMQEMNREATTIASKAEALTICQAALSIRASIEKIREQVQNIE